MSSIWFRVVLISLGSHPSQKYQHEEDPVPMGLVHAGTFGVDLWIVFYWYTFQGEM